MATKRFRAEFEMACGWGERFGLSPTGRIVGIEVFWITQETVCRVDRHTVVGNG